MNEKMSYFHLRVFSYTSYHISAVRIQILFLPPKRLQGLQNAFPLDLFVLDHSLEHHNIYVYIQKTKLQGFNGLQPDVLR